MSERAAIQSIKNFARSHAPAVIAVSSILGGGALAVESLASTSNAGATGDACPDNAADPNTLGNQLTVPIGYEIRNGQCVPMGTLPPTGTAIGEQPHPNTPHPIDTATPTRTNTPPTTDACPDNGDVNTWGVQRTIPIGYEIRNGQCLPVLTPIPTGTSIGRPPHTPTPHPVDTITPTPTSTSTPYIDYCINIPNIQTYVDRQNLINQGWTIDQYGNCLPPQATPTPTPILICPPGFYYDTFRGCYQPTPPPFPTPYPPTATPTYVLIETPTATPTMTPTRIPETPTATPTGTRVPETATPTRVPETPTVVKTPVAPSTGLPGKMDKDGGMGAGGVLLGTALAAAGSTLAFGLHRRRTQYSKLGRIASK